MTNNLRADRDSWRTLYFTYMSGFLTGANYVSYSAGDGRNSNIGIEVKHDALFDRSNSTAGRIRPNTFSKR